MSEGFQAENIKKNFDKFCNSFSDNAIKDSVISILSAFHKNKAEDALQIKSLTDENTIAQKEGCLTIFDINRKQIKDNFQKISDTYSNDVNEDDTNIKLTKNQNGQQQNLPFFDKKNKRLFVQVNAEQFVIVETDRVLFLNAENDCNFDIYLRVQKYLNGDMNNMNDTNDNSISNFNKTFEKCFFTELPLGGEHPELNLIRIDNEGKKKLEYDKQNFKIWFNGHNTKIYDKKNNTFYLVQYVSNGENNDKIDIKFKKELSDFNYENPIDSIEGIEWKPVEKKNQVDDNKLNDSFHSKNESDNNNNNKGKHPKKYKVGNDLEVDGNDGKVGCQCWNSCKLSLESAFETVKDWLGLS